MFRTGASVVVTHGSQAIDGVAGLSTALGLCMGQLASAPGEHPPEVSGVGAPPGFQVWAPSPLI